MLRYISKEATSFSSSSFITSWHMTPLTAF